MSQSDFVSRGQALVAAGQFQEAVKVCRLGLLGRPTTVEGRVVLGQALLALKRFDEVLAEMRVALDLDHTSIAAQTLKAEALLRKGDTQAAIEALHKARQTAPGDPRIMQLLGEAEHGAARPRTGGAAPGVGFISAGDTKHYPNHPDGGGPSSDFESEGFTRPTAVAAPRSARLSAQQPSAIAMPSADELAVGDRSGTVEVDPDRDGIELEGGDDFGDLASPPGMTGASAAAHRAPTRLRPPRPEPTVDLDPDDDGDSVMNETNDRARRIESARIAERRPLPGRGTAVRNAVQMVSGPIDDPRSRPPSGGPPLGRTLAGQRPAGPMSPAAPTPAALPPPPIAARPPTMPPPRPRPPSMAPPVPVAASMPTVAALQPPPQFGSQGSMPSPAQVANAARPTVAIGAQQPLTMAQQQTAAAVDAMFAADPRSLAAANEPTARPHHAALDPVLIALTSDASAAAHPTEPLDPRGLKTGVRRNRSGLRIALWVLLGILVIGGGVAAGFEIRAVRLRHQIDAARDRARDLAKSDTWTGWLAARDSLSGIVQASSNVTNRAAVARARALLAYEFGDGVAEARPVVDALAGQGGLDGDVAAAYVALAAGDAKAAKLAADASIARASVDPAASYVASQAALLAGDAKAAVVAGKAAFDGDARPLYGVGLARSFAASYAWDDALATIDRVLAGFPEHPAAVIARAELLAASGRIAPGVPVALEIRTALDKLIAEGRRPAREQAHGVSPAQVALAALALARVDFARGDGNAARADMKTAVDASSASGSDDQRFAEAAIETLLAIGNLETARTSGASALASWPDSRRLRTALAQVALAEGKPGDALDLLAKDTVARPTALAVRGQARLATGDVDGARADFEEALKKLPNLEPALVGRAWLDLAAGDVDEARKRIEPRYNPAGATAAMTAVYAAILRRAGDPASRDKARSLLDKVVTGPPSLELARAQLELARLDRDVGDFAAARRSYAAAIATGNFDARLESALLAIEDRDVKGGRETLDALLRDRGDRPGPALVIETVRARMLDGDHAGAQQLLDTADKAGVVAWKRERERGRLLLRRGDFAGAAAALGRALDGSGDDAETLLLAADAAAGDEKKSGLADKVRKLAPDRLKGRPEAGVVTGKLLIADSKFTEAEASYRAAKDALKAEKASARRLAQADFGLAVTAYNRQNDPEALTDLDLVINEDPSIYDAYLFKADILATKDRQTKQAFELARSAVRYNPDDVHGYELVGKLAHKLGDKKALGDAIARLGVIAPTSDALKSLQALRR